MHSPSKYRLPDFTWDRVEGPKEYILLCEDADLPIPTVVFHGCFFQIPGSTTAVTASDVDLVQKDGDAKDISETTVKAGFKCVKNIQGGALWRAKAVDGSWTASVL